MEFQSLGYTIMNAVMIMGAVLVLRERFASKKRREADDQELLMDLSDWEMKRIPFYKRKSRKVSFTGIAIIVAFLIFIGVQNPKAAFESLIMGLVAGSFVLYMGHIDNKKTSGVYKKGVLHKSGFIYFNNISGLTVSPSDEYEDAHDVWLLIGNTPKIQVHVPNDKIKAFEKLIKKNTRLNG